MPSSTLQTLYNGIHKYHTEKELLTEQLEEKENKLNSEQQKSKSILEAQEFLQVIAAQTQSIVEKKLSKLVTSALHTVYPENPYNFILRFEKKRNATECKLLFEKNGQEFNPLEESGGGPIDIASIALLISFIMIEKKNPIIILDEPMKHMSKKRSIIAAKFLKSICENLGLQIIMVTHLDEIILHAHKSFEIIEGTVNE